MRNEMELSYKMVIKAFLFAVLVVSTIIAVLFITLISMNPLEPEIITVIVQNRTNRTLEIYQNDLSRGMAMPSDAVKYRTDSIYPNYHIFAKDTDGKIVFETNFTSDELRGKREYRVVIPWEYD